MWIADLGFEKLRKHRALIEAAKGTSEAATRLRAVDTILFDILGWDKATVEPENIVAKPGLRITSAMTVMV